MYSNTLAYSYSEAISLRIFCFRQVEGVWESCILTQQFLGVLYFLKISFKTKQFFLHFISVFLYICLYSYAAKRSQMTLYLSPCSFTTAKHLPSFWPPGVVSSLCFRLSLTIYSPFLDLSTQCPVTNFSAVCLVFWRVTYQI